MNAYAVVFTHIPDTGETFHTPFTGANFENPLAIAHAFREAEEERGDFPGSLWCVTGNDAAMDIHREYLMAMVRGERS